MINRLSSKMILATIVLVFICSGAFLYLSINEHESVYKRTVFNHLRALSGNLADDLVAPMGEGEVSFQLATKLLALESYENIKYAIIYDSQSAVLQQYLAPSFMQTFIDQVAQLPININNTKFGVHLQNGQLVALKTIGEDEFPLGYLLIVKGFSEPLKRSNNDLIASSFPVALLILLSMIGLAVILSRRLLSPLSRLSEFTESISSSSNYNLRFEHSGKDEVANLGMRVNSMLARIEEQNIKASDQLKSLEEHQESLKKAARFDPLTGLPNRKYFKESLRSELSRAKRKGSNVIVLFLDLDDFKRINDTLGHEAGDQLLIKVSQLIDAELRQGDILSRLGGDEFLIMLNDASENVCDIGINISQRIIHALEAPILINGWEVATGVSIGIADAINAGFKAEILIRNADMAMYHAKDSGRNTYAMFQEDLQAVSMRKMLIANALTKALVNNEFSVVYQAKVNSQGEVNGLEALIRWESDFDGNVSPAEFIPVAESSGKVTVISQWVIGQVFSDIASLLELLGHAAVVSINLSVHDIKDLNFTQFIKKQLKKYKVDPNRIEFEITESAYFDNFEYAESFFSELHQLGFLIALDDFGTGYSSMSYLTRLKIDTLKIDRAFINKLGKTSKDKMILEAIIILAKNLGLNICAEGVETLEQKNFLFAKGCQQVQGFLYAKPIKIEELPVMIEQVKQKFQQSTSAIENS